MALHLSRKQHQQLLDWANDAGLEECCGLVLGEGKAVSELRLTQNVADNPLSHFEIDPAALILAERESRQGGSSLLGYFHSHPNGLERPSDKDAADALADGRVWLIIANGRITAWKANADVPDTIRFEAQDIIVEG
jgi:desampylase